MKELILNENQSEEEQRALVDWHHQMMAKDQRMLPGAPLSLDVEEVQATLEFTYSTYQLSFHREVRN